MRWRGSRPDERRMPAIAWRRALSSSLVQCGMLAFLACGARAAAAQQVLTLTSSDLQDGRPLPEAFANTARCGGSNQSPQLSWHGAPAATRSFAVTIFDVDAPGHGWWHWAVALLPRTVDHLVTNASALGVVHRLGAIEARNDFGDTGYGGPCPPPGKPHHYVITVYALNTDDLSLDNGRPAMMFEHEIRVATLASAKLTVTYGH